MDSTNKKHRIQSKTKDRKQPINRGTIEYL